MIGRAGQTVVEIPWIANPFREKKFEEVWAPAAEAALDYGASAYAFYRSKDAFGHFTQLAFFESKLDFDRYWYSEEMAEYRVKATGLFNVPVLPVWHEVVGAAEAEPLTLPEE